MFNLSDEEAAALLGVDPLDLPGWAQGVLITDGALPDNPIVYANAGFQKLTGFSLEDVLGKNCRFLQGPKTGKSAIAAIRHAIANKRRYNGDILNYRQDGTEFWNQLSLGPLASSGSHDFYLGLQLDAGARHLQDPATLAA